MNISEAQATNVLLRRLFKLEDRGGERPPLTDDQVVEAAALLADKAHKALGAGAHSSTIHAHRWAL